MAMSPRKRVQSRHRTELKCLFREEGKFQWIEGEVVNLSTGGICLKTKSPPARDSIIEIEIIVLTDKEQLKKRKLRAEVMWRRGIRAGLRFQSKSRQS